MVSATGAVATTGTVAALAVFTNGVGAAAGAGVPNSSTTNVVGSPSYIPLRSGDADLRKVSA